MFYYIGAFFRVTGSLVIREISTRFGNKPGGYLWAFIEPISYIIMMSLIFGQIARVPALGESYLMFFATGYLSFSFYKGAATYIGGAITANKALFSYPNIAPIDAVAARTIVQTATHLLVTIIVLTTIHFRLRSPLEVNFAPVMESILLATMLGVGMAMFNIPMKLRFPLYDKVFGIVMGPIMMLSGVFYLPDMMPQPARDWLLLNPLCHIVMLFRVGFYPEYRALGLNIQYALDFVAILFFGGFLVFTLNSKFVRGT